MFRQPPGFRPFDVLAFGDPTVDIVLAVDRTPGADQKVLARRLGTFGGGTAANVACALSRLGRRAATFGRVGDDAEGRFLAADFARFGVGTDHLRTVEAATAMAMIMVMSSGEKALVFAPMAGSCLEEDGLRQALRASALVYLMPYDLDECRSVARLARAEGVDVAIDIEPAVLGDGERLRQLLAEADIVFLNAAGFEAGTGQPAGHDAMRALLAFGPRMIVVTLGGAGAMAVAGEQSARTAAYPAKVVDTTGAGDGFNAAFLAACLHGQPLQAALRFAAAAASLGIAAVGARTALPTWEAVVTRVSNGTDRPAGSEGDEQ